MSLRRGLSALKATKAQQASGGNSGLRFIMREGDTALIRVYGNFESEEDPLIYEQHYIKRLGKDGYKMCANNAPAEAKHPGCAYCWAKNNGDKGIGAAPRALFFLKDMRKQHKFDTEVKVIKAGYVAKPGVTLPEAAYEMTKYPTCKGQMCTFCKQGNVAQVQGYRYWELAVQYAEQLVSLQAELRNFCRCGARCEDGTGTIYAAQYTCGHCSQPVEFFPEQGKPVATCDACKQTRAPNEELACTACEEPARCDLQDFMFRVKRTGGGTDTSYNFEVVHPAKPPTEEELAEAAEKKPNFEDIVAPEPHEIQCGKLGIPPIFQTQGHGATPYAERVNEPRPGGGARATMPAAPSKTAAKPPSKGFYPSRAPQPAPTKPGVKFKFPKAAPTDVEAVDETEIPYA